MQEYIFLTIFLLALQSPTLNAFHLDGADKNLQDELHLLKPAVEAFINETVISTNKTHDDKLATKSTFSSPNKAISNTKSNTETTSTNTDHMKDFGSWLTPNRHSVPEKTLNFRTNSNHPKRESFGHSVSHKKSKDLHKLGLSVNNVKDNSFGVDVVVVDITPSYSRLRWDKPRFNTLVAPPFPYATYPTSSIFDLLMGLNSVAMSPPEMVNDVYLEQNLDRAGWDSPFWNRRSSFSNLVSPAVIQRKINDEKVGKDRNAIKLSETNKNCSCSCMERNDLH